MKLPGCNKKSSVIKEYNIEIPRQENGLPTLLAASSVGPTFKVDYVLKCYVKVKSVFEVGQGICLNMPLVVYHNPIAQ